MASAERLPVCLRDHQVYRWIFYARIGGGDLIVVNALYRPATLDVGATEELRALARRGVAPVCNFGTYVLRRTMLVCRSMGAVHVDRPYARGFIKKNRYTA